MAWGQGKGRKSPLIARILSFMIPGSGHFYAGQFSEGLIWLLISIPWIILIILAEKFEAYLKGIMGFPFYVLGSYRYIISSLAWTIYILYLIRCANSSAIAIINYNVRKREKEDLCRIKMKDNVLK